MAKMFEQKISEITCLVVEFQNDERQVISLIIGYGGYPIVASNQLTKVESIILKHIIEQLFLDFYYNLFFQVFETFENQSNSSLWMFLKNWRVWWKNWQRINNSS